MMYFGPCEGSKKYFEQTPGIEPSLSSPADFVIIIASEIGNGTSTCELNLEEMETRARQEMATVYSSFPVKELNLSSSKNRFSVTGGLTLETLWRTVKTNVLADIEDIKKSPVTVQILLAREFLKEVRRWKYWLT